MLRRHAGRGMFRATWGRLAWIWAVALGCGVLLQEPPTAYVHGLVVDGYSQTAAGVSVLCRGMAGPSKGRVLFGETDLSGTFDIPVPPGTYEVEAVARDESQTEPQSVTLRDGQTSDLSFRLLNDTQPWVDVFAPQRVFLTSEEPRIGIRGLSVNGTARVIVERVDLLQMTAEVGAGAWLDVWGGSVDGGDLKRLAPYLERLSDRHEPLDRPGANFVNHVTLPAREPGAYLVTVSIAGMSARTTLTVTDLGLVAKTDGRKSVVYACDLASGAPKPGVELRLYLSQRAEQPAVVTTTADGLATMPEIADASDSATILGLLGNDVAVVRTHRWYGENDQREVLIYTDRPIYRPGQHVWLKGIVRDRNGADWTVPAAQPVKLRVADGRGDQVAELTATTNDFGSFTAELDIPEESFVGEFEIDGAVGEADVHSSFTVKAYVKPEYEVSAAGPEQPLLPDGTVRVAIAATYFFDSPVAGAKVRYTVQRHESWWEPPRPRTGDAAEDWDLDLPDWEEALYRGDEADDYAYGEEVATGQAVLDDAGRLILELPAEALLPPAPTVEGTARDGNPIIPEETRIYGVDIECVVSDGSGREERATAHATLLPVDLLLRTERDDQWTTAGRVTLDVAAITATGQGVAEQFLTIQPFRSRWVEDCVTDRDAWIRPVIPNGHYHGCTIKHHIGPHRSRQVILAIEPTRTVTGPDGHAAVDLRLPYQGEWQVVISGADGGGRPVVGRRWIYVTNEAGRVPDRHYEAELELNLERKHYFVGQRPQVRLSAKAERGWALLTHEGRYLAEPRVLQLSEHFAKAEVTAQPADIPNGWVAAAMVRDKELHQSEASFQTDLKARLLDVEVRSSRSQAAPGDPLTFTVRTTRGGQPVDAEVSLAVVDEAIYAMKRDHPDRLITAFYGRQWNRVGTFFSAEPYYYTAGKDEAGPVRRHFPDTALWQPNLRTGQSGEVSVTLNLPDNLSTWRATAMAHSAATEVGFGTTRVLVKKPLMVRLTTPRFLTSGDRVELNAMVHNETRRAQDVAVSLEAARLEVGDKARRNLRVAAGERAKVTWRAACGAEREVTIRVTATAGGLRDAVERTLPVVPFAAQQAVVERGRLTAGQPAVLRLAMPAGAMLSRATLDLHVAPTVGGEIAAAAESLIDYPYGCVEQTTSRFLGCLAAQQAFDALEWRQMPPFDRATVAGHVRSGLLRLRRMQGWRGGWGWWEGGGFDEQMTAYALGGLHVAKEAGYLVDTGMLDEGLATLRKAVKAGPCWQDWQDEKGVWHYDYEGRLTRSRTLETLVRCGQPLPPGVLEQAFDRLGQGRAMAAALLALAAHGDGDKPHRDTALAQLDRLLELGSKHETEDAWRYGADRIETVAWALRAELACRGLTPAANRLSERLRQSFGGERWVSTRDSAMAILALCEWLTVSGEQPVRGALTVIVNGLPQAPFAFDEATAQGQGARFKIGPEQLQAGANQVELRLAGQGTPHYLARLAVPVTAARLEPVTAPDGTVITRQYRRLERTGDHRLVARPIRGGRLAVDDVVQVELRVTPAAEAQYVMLEDPLPAGCEVMDRGETVDDDPKGWDNWFVWCAARDIKDDHVAFFLDRIQSGKPFTLRYLIRAAVPGRYRVLPPRLAPMYQPENLAAGDDDLLTVR